MKKISLRIISLFLAVIIAFSVSSTTFACTTTILPQIVDFISMLNEVKKFINSVIGFELFDTLELKTDEKTGKIIDDLGEKTPLDLRTIVATLPSLRTPSSIVGKVFHVDVGAVREKFLDARDECYHQRKDELGNLFFIATAFIGKIDSYEVRLEPAQSSKRYADYLEFLVILHYEDGGTTEIWSGAYYDTETGLIFGYGENGLADIGYDYDTEKCVAYATLDCWMRDLGFCVEYDILANLLTAYNFITRRFYFNYDGREWLIQAWKGNYSITNGAEVGVYNREPWRAGSFYDCLGDDELMKMSMSLYYGDELVVSVDEQPHWWVNSFKMSDELYKPSDMTLYFTIEMPDKGMLDAFCRAIDRNIHHDVFYAVDGLKVSVKW